MKHVINQKLILSLNLIVPIFYQFLNFACGVILPRYILQTYGSEINGLTNSILHFLQIITFFEFGIGSVMQSSLYKPLLQNDLEGISAVVSSATKFFNKLLTLFIIYVTGLIFVYPFLIDRNFSFIYTDTLILILAFGACSQYYFGIVDRLLLAADQRQYLYFILQSIIRILNTLVAILIMIKGGSIHIVKASAALIYLISPLGLRLYVNKYYKINRHIKYKQEPIQQKKNAVARHIAAFVFEEADVIILTLVSTLQNVSVYSVYILILSGLYALFSSCGNAFKPYLGKLFASESPKLKYVFDWFEWGFWNITIIILGSTAVLILPFLKIYTAGINDANYLQPLFSIVIVICYILNCVKIVYAVFVMAIGHYKQTQRVYIVTAILNLGITLILVPICGLPGAAIGTLIANIYHVSGLSIYSYKFLNKEKKYLMKQAICVLFIFVLGFYICHFLSLKRIAYTSWIFLAIKTVLIYIMVTLFFNTIFYKKEIKTIYKSLITRFKRTA